MTIEALYDLVHQFPQNEQLVIRNTLKGLKENEENRYLQLFEFIITQKKKVSRKATSLAMYKALPDTRMNKLISRLWNKILEIISSEAFIRKNVRLDGRALSRIGVRKKMHQAGILLFLNGTSYAHDLLIDEAIAEAQKGESHWALVELYGVKKQLVTFNNNSKEEEEFCKHQIAYYRQCHIAQEKVVLYYNEITKNDGYGNLGSPKKQIRNLKTILEELKKEKQFLVSDYSKYLLGMIQLEYFLLMHDYVGAKKFLHQMLLKMGGISLAGGSGHVATRVETELSSCELFLGNYDKAIFHVEKALAILKGRNSLNYYVSLEGLFYPVFYKENFERAEAIIEELLSEKNPFRNNFRLSKPFYFKACVHFKKREYKQALRVTNKRMPLSKDKTGYDLALRILRIQCLYSLRRFDEATTHIENLRKHISRNYKRSYTSERKIIIARILVLMQKRGFSGPVNKVESGLVSKLSSASRMYQWRPMTPELIKFHEWYKEVNSEKNCDGELSQ